MAKPRIGMSSKKAKRPKSRCGLQNKVRYPTERIANKALNAIWRSAIYGQYKGEKMPCRCYGPCKLCRGYHLTSQPLNR